MSERTNGGVYVRARTSDGRWASVNAMDLDERSFRVFLLRTLADAGYVASIICPWPELSTPLTKVQAETDVDSATSPTGGER